MNISTQSKQTIDACRFCWMCRHVCPIGNATGQERNTSRARALSLSLVERGAAKLEKDIVDNVYECALCGGCTNNCVTGWDPVQFTKEARLEAALNGNLPPYVEQLVDNQERTGNIYGVTELPSELRQEIQTVSAETDTLLFLGADARYRAPEAAVAAIRLLKALGVSFTVLEEEPDSGYSFDFLLGAAEETRQIMSGTAQRLRPYQTVIALDPADAKVFLREYKEWNIPLTAKTVTITAFLEGWISEKEIALKQSGQTYTYQDPALLARDLEETEPARKLLAKCGPLREMLLNRQETMLGGNLIMNEYMPAVMQQVARNRVANARHVSAETIVCASVADYAMMKAASEDIKVMTLEEVLLQCL